MCWPRALLASTLAVLWGILPAVCLAQSTGGVAGRIIDAATDFPLAGVLVDVHDESGRLRAFSLTDVFGTYRVDGLAPGLHYVTTSNRDGYVDERFDDVACPFSSCRPRLGTAVAVEAGAVTRNVTFRLTRGGSVSGRVIAEITGAPLPDRTVTVYDERGRTVASVLTGDDGTFSLGGFVTGRYTAQVNGVDDFVGELYEGVLCPSEPCDAQFGTPFSVELGADTGGVDFSLTKGGSFSGRVTDADTGAAVLSRVTVFDVTGRTIRTVNTDGDGSYTIRRLLKGTYYARAEGVAAHLRELYGGQPCAFGCLVTAGSPIVVDLGTETAGIDFALRRGVSISGTVTGGPGGEPLDNVYVAILDLPGTELAVALTDEEGHYETGPLPAGTYLVRTQNRDGFLGELYDGIPCPSRDCDLATGTPIVAELGTDAEGIDFAMPKGGTLSGTVTDVATGEPIAGALAQVRGEEGSYFNRTDEQGRYAVDELAAGDYLVLIVDSAGFIGELYDGVPCPFRDCDLASGASVVVELGEETGGVDFALARGGSVSGTVTSETGEPIADVPVTVSNEAVVRAGSVRTGAAGDYRVDGLAAGSYFVRTDDAAGFLGELYDGVPCPANCDPAPGTPVAVEAGVETSGVDFVLRRGGSVSGTVTDEAGAPVDILVSIRGQDGAFGRTAEGDGTYVFGGLRAGPYNVWVRDAHDFLGELYDDIPCPLMHCDFDSGTPVAVEAGMETGGIDFVLSRGGKLSGTVTDAAAGQPLAWAQINLLDTEGFPRYFARTGSLGRFRFRGLAVGSFRVRASNVASFMGELYDDIPCPFGGCETADGAVFDVALGVETAGVDFGLERGGSLSGRLTDAASGQLTRRFARLDIFDDAGSLVTFVNSRQDGTYRANGLPAGTYFVLVPPFSSFLGELYDGIACRFDCDVTAGVGVEVEVGADTGGVDFAVTEGGSISGELVIPDAADLPITAVIDLFDEEGALVSTIDRTGATAPVSLQSLNFYQFRGLPAGTYFVRAVADGVVRQLYDGVPCPDECDATTGTPVVVELGSDTGDIDFALAREP